MTRTTRNVAIAAGAAAVLAGGAGIAAASGASTGDDAEQQITGDALDRASRAALDHTGGGAVTDTEVGDEESLYEVEVTLGDGTQVDVQLDARFTVVDSGADVEGDDGDESSS